MSAALFTNFTTNSIGASNWAMQKAKKATVLERKHDYCTKKSNSQ